MNKLCPLNSRAATFAPLPTGENRSVFRMFKPLNGSSRQLWSREFCGAWILREEHEVDCGCGYCKELNCTIGLTLPQCKARNSWRILSWIRDGKLQVLRWTLPSFWPTKE